MNSPQGESGNGAAVDDLAAAPAPSPATEQEIDAGMQMLGGVVLGTITIIAGVIAIAVARWRGWI